MQRKERCVRKKKKCCEKVRKINLFILKMKLNETNLRKIIDSWTKEMWMKLCIQILLNSWSLWWYTICSKWTRLWMIYKSIYFRLSISSYVLFSFLVIVARLFIKPFEKQTLTEWLKNYWKNHEIQMNVLWGKNYMAKC